MKGDGSKGLESEMIGRLEKVIKTKKGRRKRNREIRKGDATYSSR